MTTDSDQHDPKEVKGFIVEWSLEVRDNVVCLVWDVDNNSDREVIVITPLFVDMILIMMFDSFVVSLAGKMPVAASCVKIL